MEIYKIKLIPFFIIFLFLFISCSKFENEPEATSLSGKKLFPLKLSNEKEKEFQKKLSDAIANYENDKSNVDKYIWVGRQHAYLGNYRKSISWYTEGLNLFPDNYKLLRHRGHRYISLRQFDNAISDLEKSSKIISNLPDEVEQDGLPNKFNIPTSTSHSNIWYHLGLVYYLKKDFNNAERAFTECLKFSKNNDMLCATLDWLYMSKMRLNKKEEAILLLKQISPEMNIIENHAYFNRLMMYKGLEKPEELLSETETDPVTIATQGYGVGNWYLTNGDTLNANIIFNKVVSTKNWSAFGFIAAEVELH